MRTGASSSSPALQFGFSFPIRKRTTAGNAVGVTRRWRGRVAVRDSARVAMVAPFPLGSVTDRAYFIVRTPATAGRPEVAHFVDWLIAEAAAMTPKDGDAVNAGRKSRGGKK